MHAPRYSEGEQRQVAQAVLPLRKEPRFDSLLESEALLGELVTVYEESEGWAWAQLARDTLAPLGQREEPRIRSAHPEVVGNGRRRRDDIRTRGPGLIDVGLDDLDESVHHIGRDFLLARLGHDADERLGPGGAHKDAA